MSLSSLTTASAQVSAHLAFKGLTPTAAWLAEFLSSQKPTTPLPALKQTALFRLLASDITETLIKSTPGVFPSDVLNGEIKERHLPGPIPVQIVDVEDVGRSKWSQIDAIEAAERGETTKGREIVRVVPGEEGSSGAATSKGGPHKLVVQDANGVRIFAFEAAVVDGVSSNMSLGAKMVLKNVQVARAVLILKPECASLLGGRIESLDKIWKAGRKEELMKAFEGEQS